MGASALIIEDDKNIQEFVSDLLIKNNYTVRTSSLGSQGIKLVESLNPDLIILDLQLPDIEGEGLCTEIKSEHPQLPIIVLTAKTSITDKVGALNLGADDYITKPFNSEELLARIRARLRQTSSSNNQILKVGDLEVDMGKVEVKRADKPIKLTAHEFNLLVYLMQNSGTVLSRDMILNRVWSYTLEVETRVVDVYMGYLRKKIDSGHKLKLIHSVRGFGYSLHA